MVVSITWFHQPIATSLLPVATIIIPVATYHFDLAQRAVASAEAQSVSVEVVVIEDQQTQGAGWARNQGLATASAPFVVFLDADDELDALFVEKCVIQWSQRQPSLMYLYTDWRVNDTKDEIRYANDDDGSIFQRGMFHIITTVLPTRAAIAVGGFDEGLPTLEDEDFYLKIGTLGFCPVRVPEALVRYHIKDGHSATNSDNGQQQTLIDNMHRLFFERYGRFRDMACNCKQPKVSANNLPTNPPQEGFVIAAAMYTHTRKPGPVSKIVYNRVGMGELLWVHPEDAAMRPDWWHVLADPASINPDVNQVMELMRNG